MNTGTERTSPPSAHRRARLDAFAVALDALRNEIDAELGAADVAHMRRVDRVSRASEAIGRLLIHASVDPVTFSAGVLALFLHKQLQAMEIGHTALHGVFDRLEGAEKFRARTFYWDTPVDERAWRHAHNVRHHPNTNVAESDPDIALGLLRTTEHTPWRAYHRLQVPYALFVLAPNFGLLLAAKSAGMQDVYWARGRFDYISDRSPATVLRVHRAFLRKAVPYALKEYVVYPALAGPLFAKVALGNWIAGTMRDVVTATAIFCNHVGEEIAAHPAGATAGSRGEFYARLVESTRDVEVGPLLSILFGGLDRHIEHHLFPHLPPNRLRAIAPRVRAICEAHGVRYEKKPLRAACADVLRRWRALARPGAAS